MGPEGLWETPPPLELLHLCSTFLTNALRCSISSPPKYWQPVLSSVCLTRNDSPHPSFPLGAFCHLHFRKAKGRGKTWTGAGRLEQELLNQGRFVCSFSIAEIAMTWQCRYTDMYTFSLPFSPFPTPLSMKMVSRLLKNKFSLKAFSPDPCKHPHTKMSAFILYRHCITYYLLLWCSFKIYYVVGAHGSNSSCLVAVYYSSKWNSISLACG